MNEAKAKTKQINQFMRQRDMITMECRLNKIDNDWIFTVYEDGKPLFCMIEEEANDMVQKNKVKNFTTEETETKYIERYWF